MAKTTKSARTSAGAATVHDQKLSRGKGGRSALALRCRSRVPRRGGRDQFAVRAFVRSRHSVRGEAFLEAGAYFSSVEPAQIGACARSGLWSRG